MGGARKTRGGSNQPPIADAGANQIVVDGDGDGSELVTLDGSASRDPDGQIVSWDWFENGEQIATGESPTVSFTTEGSPHQVYLIVTDDAGAASNSYDLVVISVVLEIGCVKGDFDANGSVNPDDVGPFVAVLLDPGAFTFDKRCIADTDRNSTVNGSDVSGFVECLIAGICP